MVQHLVDQVYEPLIAEKLRIAPFGREITATSTITLGNFGASRGVTSKQDDFSKLTGSAGRDVTSNLFGIGPVARMKIVTDHHFRQRLPLEFSGLRFAAIARHQGSGEPRRPAA